MEEILKIAVISIISVVLALILSDKSPFFTICIVLATSVLILGICLVKLDDVWNSLGQLIENSGLSMDIFEPVIKVCGIAIIVKISGDICKDAGFSSVAGKIQFAGSISSIIAVFPLFLKIIDLLQSIV